MATPASPARRTSFPYSLAAVTSSARLHTEHLVALSGFAAEARLVEHELALRPTRWLGTLQLLRHLGISPYTAAAPTLQRQLLAPAWVLSQGLAPFVEGPTSWGFVEIVVRLPSEDQREYVLAFDDARIEKIARLEHAGLDRLTGVVRDLGKSLQLPSPYQFLAADDLHEGSKNAKTPGVHLHLRLYNLTATKPLSNPLPSGQ